MVAGWQRSGWARFCVVSGIGLVLAGCDYWPPALQTQIEQLRSEVQAATAERAQLQNQLGALTKVKDDLQAQVDDLMRANREKTSMINSLQNSLAAAQEQLAKHAKSAPSKASTAKAPAKSSSKTAAKASAKKKTTAAH
jgi:outer membrane murein-binding lipoprotein Lpp